MNITQLKKEIDEIALRSEKSKPVVVEGFGEEFEIESISNKGLQVVIWLQPNLDRQFRLYKKVVKQQDG